VGELALKLWIRWQCRPNCKGEIKVYYSSAKGERREILSLAWGKEGVPYLWGETKFPETILERERNQL